MTTDKTKRIEFEFMLAGGGSRRRFIPAATEAASVGALIQSLGAIGAFPTGRERMA